MEYDGSFSMYAYFILVELPASSGYGSMLTAKNYENNTGLDLSRGKPDPLADMQSYNSIFMAEDDFRAPPGHNPSVSMKGNPKEIIQNLNGSPRRHQKSEYSYKASGLDSPLKKPAQSKEAANGQSYRSPPNQDSMQVTSPTKEQIKTAEKVGYLFSPEIRAAKRQEERAKVQEMKLNAIDSGSVERVY